MVSLKTKAHGQKKQQNREKATRVANFSSKCTFSKAFIQTSFTFLFPQHGEVSMFSCLLMQPLTSDGSHVDCCQSLQRHLWCQITDLVAVLPRPSHTSIAQFALTVSPVTRSRISGRWWMDEFLNFFSGNNNINRQLYWCKVKGWGAFSSSIFSIDVRKTSWGKQTCHSLHMIVQLISL